MKLKFCIVVIALVFSENILAQNEAPVAMTSAQYESENLGEFARKASSNADAVIIYGNLVTRLPNCFLIDEFQELQVVSTVKYFKGNTESSDSMAVVENECGKFLYVKKNSEWVLDKFKMEKPNISLRNIHVGSSSKQVYENLKLKQGKRINNGQIWIMSPDGKKRLELTFINYKIVLMELV
jgi:hypothetical protein